MDNTTSPIKLNLLPKKTLKQILAIYLNLSSNLLWFLCLILFSHWIVLFTQTVQKNKKLNELQNKINNSSIFQSALHIQANNQNKKLSLELLNSISKQRSQWAAKLEHLTNVMPKGIWLDSLSIDKSSDAFKLILEGKALNNGDIINILRHLEETKWLSKVVLEYTKLEQENDKTINSFKISANCQS